jgi:hypothetical protein
MMGFINSVSYERLDAEDADASILAAMLRVLFADRIDNPEWIAILRADGRRGSKDPFKGDETEFIVRMTVNGQHFKVTVEELIETEERRSTRGRSKRPGDTPRVCPNPRRTKTKTRRSRTRLLPAACTAWPVRASDILAARAGTSLQPAPATTTPVDQLGAPC